MLNGTNFRHAVEFSRSGCARFDPLRPPWGNPIYATRLISRSQILRSAFRATPASAQHVLRLICWDVVTLAAASATVGNPIHATRSISRSQILRSAFRAPPTSGQHVVLLIVREGFD